MGKQRQMFTQTVMSDRERTRRDTERFVTCACQCGVFFPLVVVVGVGGVGGGGLGQLGWLGLHGN